MAGDQSAKGQLLFAGLLFLGMLAAVAGTDVAVLALLAYGPLVTAGALVGVVRGSLELESANGLILACLFALLTVLALLSAMVGTDPVFRNLVIMFGVVVDFLAGIGAVLAVRVADGTERPTPGPPHRL